MVGRRTWPGKSGRPRKEAPDDDQLKLPIYRGNKKTVVCPRFSPIQSLIDGMILKHTANQLSEQKAG
jgi:hypothetical protein